MRRDGNSSQTVAVQLNGITVRTIQVGRADRYFDVRIAFAAPGDVRLAYRYPDSDPFLPPGLAGTTVYSRTVMLRLP